MTDTTQRNTPAITALIESYRQFQETHVKRSTIFETLVREGQKPKVMVIGCCDSRADPAILTSANPGDLFVVRNIANLVPPFQGETRYQSTSAALEFAVLTLKVSDIIVLGHSHCGGIEALVATHDKEHNSDFIHTWMNLVNPIKQRVFEAHPDAPLAEQAQRCEKASVLNSRENLKTFPWIKSRLAKNNLFLHAWYFNLQTQTIETYCEKRSAFFPIDEQR